jgi:hypothetical protein
LRVKDASGRYIATPLMTRVWEKITVLGPDDCWPWNGAKNNGYGVINAGGKATNAHRLVLEEKLGRKDFAVARHICNNRECCNPGHLEPGSVRDNVHDCIRSGRRNDARGTEHPRAKLTEEQVLEIRNLYRTMTQVQLAKRFNVSRSAIRAIVEGRNWAWL